MAIRPDTKYSGQIDTSDSTNYPYGKARNVTTSGDGTGTPLEKDWLNDWWGFVQHLFDETSSVPSGNVDTAVSSQIYDTLLKILKRDLPVRYVGLVTSPSSSTDIYVSEAGKGIQSVSSSSTTITVTFAGSITSGASAAAILATGQKGTNDANWDADMVSATSLTLTPKSKAGGAFDPSTLATQVFIAVLGAPP